MNTHELISELEGLPARAIVLVDSDGHSTPVNASQVQRYWTNRGDANYAEEEFFYEYDAKETRDLGVSSDQHGIYKEIEIPPGESFSGELEKVKVYLIVTLTLYYHKVQ